MELAKGKKETAHLILAKSRAYSQSNWRQGPHGTGDGYSSAFPFPHAEELDFMVNASSLDACQIHTE